MQGGGRQRGRGCRSIASRIGPKAAIGAGTGAARDRLRVALRSRQGGDRGRNGRGAARRGRGGQGQAGEQYAAPVLAPCIRPPAALSPAPPARASFQCDMIDI